MSHEQLISVQIKVVNGIAGKPPHLPCGGVRVCGGAHMHLPRVSGDDEATAT